MDYHAYPVPILERRIENARIQMTYPEIQGLGDLDLQTKMNEKIRDTVYKTIWNHGFDKDPGLFVTGNTQVTLNKAGILSMVMRMSFENKAYSTRFLKIKALTVNLQNGTIYKFEDLFKNNRDYVARLNKIIKRQIVEQAIPVLKKFHTVERDQRFYLTSNSLVIYFPHHEYTPIHLGILEFTIPYAELRDLAYEKGPLHLMKSMESRKLSVGESANGQNIRLMIDQTLEVSLTTNPTTGYTWQYIQKPNPDILQETRHFLLPQGKNPGSPSQEYWQFSPVNGGTTSIAFEYKRSWSKEPPLKTFAIQIVVS